MIRSSECCAAPLAEEDGDRCLACGQFAAFFDFEMKLVVAVDKDLHQDVQGVRPLGGPTQMTQEEWREGLKDMVWY